MTDNEIIKALECCIKSSTGLACEGCPLLDANQCIGKPITYVSNLIVEQGIDLINRLKAENEKFNVELVGMRGACNSYKMHYDNAQAEIKRLKKETKDLHKVCDKAIKTYKETKSEARKEFAMSLVEISYIPNMSLTGEYIVSVSDIKNLLKEMEEN